MGKTGRDAIRITGLEVFANHGVYQEEKEKGQYFVADITLISSLQRAGLSDDLWDSTDYAEVCDVIYQTLRKRSYNLIEKAAEVCTKAILLKFPYVEEVEFTLHKPNAPISIPFESVSVTLRRGWHDVYVAFGSNMGDSNAFIDGALAGLKEDENIKVVAESSRILTKPYGVLDQPDFLNGVWHLKTMYEPEELLKKLHALEQEAGRVRKEHWGPRTLDLDILFYDKEVYESDVLMIPHGDLQNREFVLRPMAELSPYFRHPLLHKSMKELLEDLSCDS